MQDALGAPHPGRTRIQPPLVPSLRGRRTRRGRRSRARRSPPRIRIGNSLADSRGSCTISACSPAALIRIQRSSPGCSRSAERRKGGRSPPAPRAGRGRPEARAGHQKQAAGAADDPHLQVGVGVELLAHRMATSTLSSIRSTRRLLTITCTRRLRMSLKETRQAAADQAIHADGQLIRTRPCGSAFSRAATSSMASASASAARAWR